MACEGGGFAGGAWVEKGQPYSEHVAPVGLLKRCFWPGTGPKQSERLWVDCEGGPQAGQYQPCLRYLVCMLGTKPSG